MPQTSTHPKIPHGLCQHCGHSGDDCTGEPTLDPRHGYVYEIEGDTAAIGALVINWTARTFSVQGVAGTALNSLSREALSTLIDTHAGSPDVTVEPFVVWPSNADGLVQLEFDDTGERVFGDDFEGDDA